MDLNIRHEIPRLYTLQFIITKKDSEQNSVSTGIRLIIDKWDLVKQQRTPLEGAVCRIEKEL